ncbi:MAG: hypothetical protein KDH09_13610, partial [Chrysiogenetes bacterium]|nr:hypothetical protein [Chrysiogenetes bacterium]
VLLSTAITEPGIPVDVTVNALDVNGNLVDTATDDIYLITSTDAAVDPVIDTMLGSLVAGTLTAQVTFFTTGMNYIIEVGDDVNAGPPTITGTSAMFDVDSSGADYLAFDTPPAGPEVTNVTWATQPVVSVRDIFGNVVNVNGRPVTLTEDGAGSFGGTNPVNTVAGIATFTDIDFDTSETINVSASSGALIGPASVAVTVGNNAPTFTNLSNSVVCPLSTVPAPIFTVTGSANDAGQSVTFTEASDSCGVFAIDAMTGDVTGTCPAVITNCTYEVTISDGTDMVTDTLEIVAANNVYWAAAAAAGAGDGSSSNDPDTLSNINGAVAAGDVVRLLDGSGGDYTAASENRLLNLVAGVQYYGGFEVGDVLHSDRDLNTGATILDGAGMADSVVVTANNTVLNGVTITGGEADSGGDGLNIGGGVFVFGNTGVEISDATISNNTATNGAGIEAQDSSLTLSRVMFFGNAASNNGGGMRVTFSGTVVATDVTFENNTAGNLSGALGLNRSTSALNQDATLTNVRFIGNSAASNGGAIRIFSGTMAGTSDLTINNGLFVGNTADQNGGGIFEEVGTGTLTTTYNHTTFRRNRADNDDSGTGDGGGIYCNVGTETPTIANSAFYDNEDGNGGAPLTADDAINCAAATVVNDTCAEQDLATPYTDSGFVQAFSDPFEFVEFQDNVFLKDGSVCQDIGDNAVATTAFGAANAHDDLTTRIDQSTEADVDGATAGTPDAGFHLTPGAKHYVDLNATGAADGTSWTDAFTHPQDAIDAASAGGDRAGNVLGDVIFVANGTYREATLTANDDVFTLTDGLSIFGGFEGVGGAESTSVAGRNMAGGNNLFSASRATVMSGDTDSSGNKNAGDSDEVVEVPSAGAHNVIDGMRVEGGFDDTGGDVAGLIASDADQILLRRVDITDNQTSSGNTAGLYVGCSVTGTRAEISASSVSQNTAGGFVGGALIIDCSDALVDRTVFDGNTAANTAGALNISAEFEPGTYVVRHSTFANNVAGATAAGIQFTSNQGTTLRVINSAFSSNSSADHGAAIAVSDTGTDPTLEIVNSSFHNNDASNNNVFAVAGVAGTPTVTVRNSVFYDNDNGNSTDAELGGVGTLTGDADNCGETAAADTDTTLVAGPNPFVIADVLSLGHLDDISNGDNFADADGVAELYLDQTSACVDSGTNAQADAAYDATGAATSEWESLTTEGSAPTMKVDTRASGVDAGVHYPEN